MDIERLSPAGGIDIANVDLADVDDDTFAEIERLFNQESLLVFRDQILAPDDTRRLIARFGPVLEGVGVVSNENATGDGELAFHSEQSFQRTTPIRGLALYGQTLPSRGAATIFINCAAAYRLLPDELRETVVDVDTVHSFDPRVRLGEDYNGPAVPASGWWTTHPAVFPHPVSGVPILFISPWFTTATIRSDGTKDDELLSALLDQLSDPLLRYRHEWRPNDLVLWDNLALIHARGPQEEDSRRVLLKHEFGLRDGVELPRPHHPVP